ncbi:BlaI/MecI/CopY family transcriptional regulator [Verrucomicrobiota bacterium]
MNGEFETGLSRRERQIMDIVYEKDEVSARVVAELMPDPPSYSAVRAMIRILEEKGHLTHRMETGRYIYRPTRPRKKAAESALRRTVNTFFGGSVELTVAGLLDLSNSRLSDAQFDRLLNVIDEARQKEV